MKKMVLILVGVGLGGCSDSEPTVGFSIQAVSQSGSVAAADFAMTDDGSGDYQLTEAMLRLRHIELDLPEGQTCMDLQGLVDGGAVCDLSGDSDKIVIDGPFTVDLVMGTTTPSLDAVIIPEGTYKRIDFRVEDNADDASFAVQATFDRRGETHTLDLSLDFNEDIRVEHPDGIVVDADTDLVAQFVVDNWLAGVDIGKCMDDDDLRMEGTTVFVDDASTGGDCSDIENTIKDNMKNSGQLDRL